MHALLLIEVVHHRLIFAGQRFEALLSPRIWKTARIENKSSAIA